MRQLFPFLLIMLLLSGCSAREASIDPTLPTAEETLPPETTQATQVTEPSDPVALLLDSLTLEEKVGQLFLARCPTENAAADAADYHLGGYILFGRDFENETPESLRIKLDRYQFAAAIPMLMAVDEEGGTVCRVSSQTAFRSSKFPSPRQAYADGGLEAVLAIEQEKTALLSDLTINVNMAPVCDIATQPRAFLYDRSLGQGLEETGRFVRGAVSMMEQQKIGSVLKHFPGYGNNADTHIGIVRDDRTLEELEDWDLLPFAEGITAGCDAILVSHTIVSALDDKLPASLSPAVHDYLRNTMGFDGVIVTDDLVMQAITDAYGAAEAAVLAVQAGNDLLCSSEYRIQYPAVLDAVREDRISEHLINDAAYRVLTWKFDLGLIS